MGNIFKIDVTDGGDNYSLTPFVAISGDGTGAHGVAVINFGRVTEIIVVDPGQDYSYADVEITTQAADPFGTGATARVQLTTEYAEHLLPPNSTQLERALSAQSRGILGIPIPIEEQWQPDNCPIEILPWLAWTLSVDDWDPDWPELDKRNAVKGSIPYHKKKGTRWAIDYAVNPYSDEFGNLSTEEWYQYVLSAGPSSTGASAPGRPYHFRVRSQTEVVAWPPDWDKLDRLWTSIMFAKNVRSYLEAIQLLGPRVTTPVYFGAIIKTTLILSNEAVPARISPHGAFYTAAVTRSRQRVTLNEPNATLNLEFGPAMIGMHNAFDNSSTTQTGGL